MSFNEDFPRSTLSAVLVACLCALCISRAVGQTDGSSSVDSQSERIAKLSPYFELQLPIGPGPYSAIVMVSGCSGFHNERFSRSYDRDGNRLVNLGYAVIRVNYVRAHGLEDSCLGARNPTRQTVPELKIAQYIQATVAYMVQRADIDPERIYLMGSSLGGGVVLTAM